MITLTRDQTSYERALVQWRAPAHAEIFKLSKEFRLRYITNLPGQGEMYKDKEIEALQYLAQNPEPADLTEYPCMALEAGVTAPTAYELAQLWANMSYMVRDAGRFSEGARQKAKQAVDAATTQAEIDAAIETLKTDLAGALT